ncbi:MAG: phosphoribosylformylglycinamidine synthase [Wenzhouxiangellaceae bacterium]
MVLNPHTLILGGAPAYSSFRLQRLRRRLERLGSKPASVAAHYFYIVELRQALDEMDQTRLLELLQADAQWRPPDDAAYFVLPHAGTLSAWSSKAGDILKRCGLSAVQRVERGIVYELPGLESITDEALELLHDRMTQDVFPRLDPVSGMSVTNEARPLTIIDLGDDPDGALQQANHTLGLALSEDEIAYLVQHYSELGRSPSDAELMMFAQANSEHCRHKIFRADWTIDNEPQTISLFDMIRVTHRETPDGVLSAYSDNAAVFVGGPGSRLQVVGGDQEYRLITDEIHVQIKAETHNHPTAISPLPGAATGSGGEIRDEAATGRGARTKAALSGFTVSDLHIPADEQPWEAPFPVPQHLASSLQIMIDGPIGAAAYNNEFGRPALCGYFRTLSCERFGRWWGYHKPIMLAGGYGNIAPAQVHKQAVVPGAHVIVLGGPALLIGLGGGAASSQHSGSASAQLDYASVQRANPEMQRRCQQVIESCVAMAEANPILSIHDVGAGGLSNAIPELLHADGCGGKIDLARIPRADPQLSPMELWCNEAQERYVLAIMPEHLPAFAESCERERCPYADVGVATADGHLLLARAGDPAAVDLSLSMVLDKAPRMHREVTRWSRQAQPHQWTDSDLEASIGRVLRLPAVGSKSFLITIADRTIGGLTVRDQMVGPWQVPVADVAVTARDFIGAAGEAMAMGERSPLAIYDAPASGRMAVGEAMTNLAAAPIADLKTVKLSANWMAAAGEEGQDADLYDTVRAVGIELCPQLGLGIPVGKDSLSMRVHWQEQGQQRGVHAPVSLIVSAFAPVSDVRRTLTPQLEIDGDTELLLIDLGRQRLGGSALAQVWQCDGGPVADLDHPHQLKALFETIQQLNREGMLQAYHDRSDGGVLVSLLEMAWAGHCGIEIQVPDEHELMPFLFNEELGAVIQVRKADLTTVDALLQAAGLATHTMSLARVAVHGDLVIHHRGQCLHRASLAGLHQCWAETSRALARLRDDPDSVDEEYQRLSDWSDPGQRPRLSFKLTAPPAVVRGSPAVAILREQGVNGHMEMAAAFMQAGFRAVDVHMSDLHAGRRSLEEFQGFVACGGFSYGDVLGAGLGWAKSILYHAGLREQFARFLERDDRFALGICNGCQMLAGLRELVPGSDHWPVFVRNRSEQFEARQSLVEITPSPSLFMRDMEGSVIPVAVAHGEGRAQFASAALPEKYVCMRYVENDGEVASRYPANPNGSPAGITGLCNTDGRVTLMMPHPERSLRGLNFSWAPSHWGAYSPWRRLFDNARQWCGDC